MSAKKITRNKSDPLMRNGHTLVLGATRVGKTRLAEILIARNIRRGDDKPASTEDKTS